MTFLEQLKKKTVCPIREIIDVKGTNGFRGSYWCQNSNNFYEGKIDLQENLPDVEKEATLIHELGHERCDKRNCRCFKLDRVLIELHAELYALHFLLRHRRKQALSFRLCSLHTSWNYSPYEEVLQILKNRRIYKRCQEFVEKDD